MRSLFSFIVFFIWHIGSVFAATPVILFDCGGVIVKPDENALVQLIKEVLHLNAAEMKSLTDSMEQAQKEGIYDKIFWPSYAASHGIVLPEDWLGILGDCYVSSMYEIPGMMQLVKELQSRGIHTPMLSNIRERHAKVIADKGIYDAFHPLFLSYAIDAWKPDRQAFDYVLGRLQIPARDCIFIDDEIQNIRAARELGIDAILFESVEQLQQELNMRDLYGKGM